MVQGSQLTAAKAIAEGYEEAGIRELAGVSRATYYRWIKSAKFVQMVDWFRRETKQPSVLPLDTSQIELSRAKDLAISEKLDILAHKLADASTEILETIEPADIPIRTLPSLIKAIRDCVECQRQGLDRVSGLEQIIGELEQIEKASKLTALPNPNGKNVTAA